MNYYAKAIEILDVVLNSQEQEHVLLLEIAKNNPSALVNAEYALTRLKNLRKMTKFEREMVLLAQTSKITAIKELRRETGLGLRESKERIEELTTQANV